MSDHYQIVAFVDLDLDDARAAATRIIDVLRARKILGGLIPQGDLSSHRMAFMTGDAAPSVVSGDPQPVQSRRIQYGVEVVIGWWAHGDGEVSHVGLCPSCGKTVEDLVLGQGPLRDAATKIADDRGETLVGCAHCGEDSLLRTWTFSPPLWFAPLAMRFGNWGPLSAAFLADLATLSGSRAKVAHELV